MTKYSCPKCGSENTVYVGCVFYTYSLECKNCGNVFPDPDYYGNSKEKLKKGESRPKNAFVESMKKKGRKVEVLSQEEFFKKYGIE